MKAEIKERVHYGNTYTLVLIPENDYDRQQLLGLQGIVRVGWRIYSEPIYSFDVADFKFTLTLDGI